MRRFLWQWLWIFALGAVLLALALRTWGGYWHITRWAKPVRPPAPEGHEEEKKAEAPSPVQGEVSEDTREAMKKHLEAQKSARRPPH